MKRNLLALSVGAALSCSVSAEVLISQYIEGYGYNKAVQVKNYGTDPVDLASYKLVQYSDGSDATKAVNLVDLSGTLAPNGTIVVGNSHSSADIDVIVNAELKATTYFNGDDAVALQKDGNVIDLIGDNTTVKRPSKKYIDDRILVRKPTNTVGNTTSFTEVDEGLWDVSPCTKKSDVINCEISNLTTQGFTPFEAPEKTMAEINGDLTTLVDKGYLTELIDQEIKVKGRVTYNDTYKKVAFIQAADDSNNNTPDGIRVQGSKLEASVGDTVWVTGVVKVDESLKENYYPLPYIELKSAKDVDAGDEITDEQLAKVIFKGDEMPNLYYDDDPTTFDPTKDGNDFLRRYAGMKVTVEDAISVTGVNKYGNVWIVANKGAHATGMTGPRGGMVVRPIDGTEETATKWDYNPEVIKVIEKYRKDRPTFQSGSELGDVTGFLTWDYGEYTLLSSDYMNPTSPKTWDREITDLQGDPTHLTVSNFNVENLVYDDDQEKFDGLAKLIVENLKSPDILALQEVGDDSGSKSDGVVKSDLTLKKLLDAIHTLDSNLKYRATYISPLHNTDGGKPGLNIRVAYLYNSKRVGFRKSENEASATDNAVVLANGKLSFNPVRVNVDHTYDDNGVTKDAFENTRKTLAAQFLFNGHTVTLLNNHWSSKRGETPVNGKVPYKAYPRRNAQAQAVRELVDSLLDNDKNAKVIALGDMNEFYYNEPMKILSGEPKGTVDMHNLTHALPLIERYSYVFGGNTQELDHLVVSDSLHKNAVAKPVHVNAEYSDQLSDHDPMVAKLLVEKKNSFSAKPANGKRTLELPLSASTVAGDFVQVTLKKGNKKEASKASFASVTDSGDNVIEQEVTDADIESKSINIAVPKNIDEGEYAMSAKLLGSDKAEKESLFDSVSLSMAADTPEASTSSSGGSLGMFSLLSLFGFGFYRRRKNA